MGIRSVEVRITVGDTEIAGDLSVPDNASGVVVFAHGSGSSRFSSRNRAVAASLNDRTLATLLLDLLTEEEDEIDRITRELRFDIPLLAGRVAEAVTWTVSRPDLEGLAVGLFGASTGAAAALIAAAQRPESVSAVVSRGGRPDLAAGDLGAVQAPTLLIVGGLDTAVIRLNETALRQMRCAVELVVVPGATHLFEEPGTLDQVAHLAGDWFATHLAPTAPPTG